MANDLITWQQALYTVSDDAFLSIMRNYLGPIQTPFNKPNLIHQLTTFLTAEETQRRILLLMDPLDRRLLSAIHYLGHANIHTLHMLFSSQLSYFQLQQAIYNLEERLLVFQTRDSQELSINPLLRERLIERVISLSHLLTQNREGSGWRLRNSIEADTKLRPAICEFADHPFINPTSLLHLLSFIAHRHLEVRSDGCIKKRSLELLTSTYIFDTDRKAFEVMLDASIEGLKDFGLLCSHDQGELYLDHDLLDRLSQISWGMVSIGLFTAAIFHSQSSQTRAIVTELLTLLSQLEEISNENLSTLCRIVAAKASYTFRDQETAIYSIIDRLIALQIIAPTIKDNGSEFDKDRIQHTLSIRSDLRILIDQCAESSDPTDGTFTVVMDSDLTLGITGALPFSELPKLSLYAEPKQCGERYSVYTITKTSVRHAFDRGSTANDIQSHLRSMIRSTTPLPQHIQLTLQNWQSEYQSIGLYQGMVLQADGMHARIIDAHPELRSYILHRLAPGIYLMDPAGESVWREILVRSGMGMLPATKSFSKPGSKAVPVDLYRTYINDVPWSLDTTNLAGTAGNASISSLDPSEECASELLSTLEQEMERKRVNGTLREEYSARIQKKLILYPEQISTAHLQRNVWEASGLDFTGKMNLCRQAIASPLELLEIHLNTPEETVYLLRPTSLDRGDRGALLSGTLLPEGTQYTVEVGKIMLLRKLRSSLFTPLS